MAQTIWKYPLAVTDEQTLRLPHGAKVLHVGVQGANVYLWAQVDPQAQEEESILLRIYGTGHPMLDVPGRYISTFMLVDGHLVFHAYEVTA